MDVAKIAAAVIIVSVAMLLGDCMGDGPGPKDLTINLDIPVVTTFDIPVTAIDLSASNSFSNTTGIAAVCNNADGFRLYAMMDNGGYLSTPSGHNMVNPLKITLPEMTSPSPLTSEVDWLYEAGSHSGNIALIQTIAIGELAGSYQGKVTIGLTPSP